MINEQEIKELRMLLCKQLRDKRLELEIPQKHIQKETAISRDTLNDIEKGNRNLTIDTLLKLLSVLDLKIALI